jgi:hypothetical protein
MNQLRMAACEAKANRAAPILHHQAYLVKSESEDEFLHDI